MTCVIINFSTQQAHEIAEQVALGVAFTLGVYNFERSNWNTQLDADKAALRFAPAAKSDAAPEALDATAWTELVLDNKFETLSAKYAMNYTLSKVEQVEEIKLLPENKVCLTCRCNAAMRNAACEIFLTLLILWLTHTQ